VVITDWDFRRIEERQEFSLSEAEKQAKWKIHFRDPYFDTDFYTSLFKCMLTLEFSVCRPIALIKCLVTADSGIHQETLLGEPFPKEICETMVHFTFPFLSFPFL